MIIYTSGTTGSPKGVEISFENIFSQLQGFQPLADTFFKDRSKGMNVLSILPMNHLFEMTVGFATFLSFGLSVYYTSSLKPKDILGIMNEKQVDFMIVVPAFLKLLKAGIETEIKNSPKAVQIAFKAMYEIAKKTPSYSARKLLFKKIHDKSDDIFGQMVQAGAKVVENNIKFSFKSSDISEEIITDSNMTQEEKSQ